MTEQEKTEFAQGKAAGAISVPLVAAATAAPALAPAAKAITAWTVAHPVATAMGYHLARELGIPLPKILDVLSKFQVEGQ
jgi:hypothetical protein